MKKVTITPELIERIKLLEKEYKTSIAFADALGIETSAIRHWKNGTRKSMTLMAYNFIVLLEEKKFTNKKSEEKRLPRKKAKAKKLSTNKK